MPEVAFHLRTQGVTLTGENTSLKSQVKVKAKVRAKNEAL